MLELPNILLSITAVSNIVLTIFVYGRNRNSKVNFFFALFTIFLVFWALVLVGYRLVEDTGTALYLMKSSYVVALLIGVSFYYFSILFPDDSTRISTTHNTVIFLASLVFVALTLVFPTFLTKTIVVHSWGKEAVLGVFEYLFFAGLFIYLFVGGLARIWINFLKSEGILRRQLFAIGASVTFAGILGIYFNLFLASPFIQDFRYIWTGPLFTFVIAITITYSIFRLKLFNPKAIAAELFTFTLWIFLLVRLLLSNESTEQLINGALLFVSVIIGILLVRSVGKEVEAREQIEKLAENLEKANARLREMDRQKSEFLSMAAHQLRTPLTAIKGYTSLMLDGDYGKLDEKLQGVIHTIFVSSSRMVETVGDFLDVSRIEQGRMEYRKQYFDVGVLAKEVTETALLAAQEKKLELTYDDDGTGPYSIYGDDAKIQHVIGNLIDNAIKYTERGRVSVHVKRNRTHNQVQIAVADTGCGIPADAIQHLFDKFVRARNAKDINVTGTGLGLYVAREMVRAHDGSIRVRSAGEGQGSIFIIDLPLSDERG